MLPAIATQRRADGVHLSAALLTRRELLEGTLLSIHWFLRVRVDQRGVDDQVEMEVKVVPRG